MSDYVKAKDALEAMHRDLVQAVEERDLLMGVIRRIGSEATDPDTALATQNIRTVVNAARKAWDERREAER